MTREQVREFCTGKLAHYKIPRYVLVVDSFPMTITGKVLIFLAADRLTGPAPPAIDICARRRLEWR